MSEILQNTGAKLWSIVDDHDELQTSVFEELVGTGGKSDIRLIDETIGKINENLNGYYFKIINDKLCICKDTESGTTSIPLSITDDNGHTALKVDGTSITIDGNGVVHGATIDDAFSLTSENAVQNKVVKAKFDEIEEKINANETTISSHKNDKNNPHSVTKEQVGLGNVEDKSSETIRGEITKDNVTTALGYTPYTPNEVDNKFSTLETNIDWKEAVNTFDDIATTYPNPEDGWTVNTKDDNITYRYNGTEWIAISANAIPKATDSVDGLLSKEDHAKYDGSALKAHTHDNKSVLDVITGEKVSDWDNKSDFSGSYNDLSDKPTIPKADGTTITADEDGTLHGATTVECDTELSDTSENPVQNKVIKAQIDSLNQAIEEAKALKASLETYGMVQLNDTSVVTDSTGLALPATEKNPNLEGTLANQISQLNTDYYFEDEILPTNYAYNSNFTWKFYRIGNMIVVSTNSIKNVPTGTQLTLFDSIPEKYRPKVNMYFRVYDVETNKIIELNFETNGIVLVRNYTGNHSAVHNIGVNVMYIGENI